MYTLSLGSAVLATQSAPILYDEKQKSWVTDACVYADTARVFTVSQPPNNRHITQYAFLSRFTDAEAVMIDLASIGATVNAATMRRYQAKISAAKFIDLDWAETRAGVQSLESIGLLAAGRAQQILDAPVLPGEVP